MQDLEQKAHMKQCVQDERSFHILRARLHMTEPLTLTVEPSTLTSTPAGTAIGCLPIRDTVAPFLVRLITKRMQ